MFGLLKLLAQRRQICTRLLRFLVSLHVLVSEPDLFSADVSKDAHFLSKRWLGVCSSFWDELNDLNPFLKRNRAGNSRHFAAESLLDFT